MEEARWSGVVGLRPAAGAILQGRWIGGVTKVGSRIGRWRTWKGGKEGGGEGGRGWFVVGQMMDVEGMDHERGLSSVSGWVGIQTINRSRSHFTRFGPD